MFEIVTEWSRYSCIGELTDYCGSNFRDLIMSRSGAGIRLRKVTDCHGADTTPYKCYGAVKIRPGNSFLNVYTSLVFMM